MSVGATGIGCRNELAAETQAGCMGHQAYSFPEIGELYYAAVAAENTVGLYLD